MKLFALIAAACIVTACASPNADKIHSSSKFDGPKLQAVLDAQDATLKARYDARHPYETLKFMAIEPGMTVAEILPGDGWYTKILLPYLGAKGKLIGIDYSLTMWPNFPFGTEEFISKRKSWPQTWPAEASAWAGTDGAAVQAYAFGEIPKSVNGTVDRVIFIRALHNLARFETNGKFLSDAIKQTHAMLKPGGLVGIVQHQVDESKTDEWDDGSKGYLKASYVKKAMADAGFEFIDESDVNKNLKDQPVNEDSVWRLPPSFYTSKENTPERAQFQAIGESNRMTLLFRKSK